MASTADFKNGLVLKEEGQLWQIVEFQHVKPGKGPFTDQAQNVVTGKRRQDVRCRCEVEIATVDRRDMTPVPRR